LGSSCSRDITTDHSVLIVGYGTYTYETFVTKFFKIRNSYGTDWGIEGYMYIAYDEDVQDDDGVLGIL